MLHAAVASLLAASPTSVTLHTPFDPVIAGEGQVVAQIAIDADFEFFALNGMSVDATVAAIEDVIDAATGAFAEGPGVLFDVTAIVVRTDVNDPYTSTNPSTLFQQVKGEWTANQPGIEWDAVQLFSGKNLQGAIVAMAGPSSICTTNAVSLVTNDGLPQIGKNHLSTRQLGIVFGATTCTEEPDCGVMCPSYVGCEGEPLVFGAQAIADIQDLIGLQGACLDPAPCAVDCDGNGQLDILDFVCFQGLFGAGDPRADCDASGQLDILDFVCFQSAFQAGCD